ncbi:MAG: TauD/TfdA family dioxygenase [Deltaproteobacteria bacterium]|nr:TauD/TfdA family dioxygenase [Deltaproteobacteria bacterium]
MSYLSFAQQALHYFNRPHETVCKQPLSGPSAWLGSDLKGDDGWIVHLRPAQVAELEAAHAEVQRRGITMDTMQREDFPLPRLAAVIKDWATELLDGRGFLVVRGLPVERWGDEVSAGIYWGIGLHLGRPGAQNPQNELLGHIINTGEDASNPYVRRYRTAGDIEYHCDLADAVGLLCLRPARSGGASRIVSSVSVYNELLRRRPDLVARLYEPFALDRRDESRQGPGWVPVIPCRYAGGKLRTFFHSDYFRSVIRHADAPAFTDQEKELLDLFESIANEPQLRFDMHFERGDIQLLSNHFVLHARTAYDDDPDPRRKRHLLRLWLSLT